MHPAPGRPGDAHRGRHVRGHGLRHRLREDDPRPRPQRLRGRPAPEPGDHPGAGRQRQGGGGVRQVLRPGPLRGPEGHRGRPGGGRLPGQGGAPSAQRGHLLPLPQRRGAPHFGPVVRQDGALGQGGPAGGQRGRDQVRPRPLRQDLHQLDGERPRLVHFPSALVGPPHPRLVLRRLRQADRLRDRPRRVSALPQPAHPPGGGRAGHLVLLRPVALLHPGLAG